MRNIRKRTSIPDSKQEECRTLRQKDWLRQDAADHQQRELLLLCTKGGYKMTANINNDKIPAYGQFFHCQTQLFGQLNYDRIFMYLFNEHIKLERLKRPTAFHISTNMISKCCKVGRNTVNEALQLFANIGLVSINDSLCVVNKDYFYSVIVLFNNSNSEKKKRISDSFLKGDKQSLEELGLHHVQLDTTALAGATLLPSEQHCSHQSNIALTGATKIAQICSHWSNIALTRTYFNSKEELKNLLCTIVEPQKEQDLLDKAVDFCWNGGKIGVDWDVIAFFVEIGMKTVEKRCSDWNNGLLSPEQGGALVRTGGCSGESNSNKYNKENKEINERSSIIGDGNKDYLGFFGKVNSDIISQSLSENDEDEDNKDFSCSEKASERNERREAFRKSLNPYRDKPYFQSSEMLDIASDPTLCAESCYRLFLYNFWYEVYNQVMDSKEQANNDDDETPSFNSEEFLLDDIEGEVLSDYAIEGCIRTASNYTIENIKDGHIDGDNGKIEVNCEVADIDFSHIFDWKEATTKDGSKGYVISFSNIRNIDAYDIVGFKPSPDVRQDKKERNRQDKAYCQALRESDNSQLTTMEQAMKSFMETFIVFDEWGHIEWCLDGRGEKILDNCVPGEETPYKAIAWHIFQTWKHTLRELDIVPEDFYAMFNTQPNFKDGMELDLRRVNNIFSYKKSVEWHKKHGIESKIEIEAPSE